MLSCSSLYKKINKDFYLKRSLIIITVITLICVLSSVWGSPASYKPPGFHDGSSIGYEDLEDKCNTDESVQILCQTCAKVTKSEIVYPMCCTNKEDARVCYSGNNVYESRISSLEERYEQN
ncbi:hypothetical protein LSTR_LSTR004849 [Laodelphax striatellus]|uniref:Uncharacterized protein n=1 Tax=Laodelphax striatellus TaxID=195883 RepID=A0A482WI40_LAOST|nr:hypothetical protein LSTR_LSTR004849 [Laodelphax striatellus]